MIVAPEAGWPKTPSGAIDWEQAFEAPGTGLISLVLQARSPAAMRGCMIVVVRRLYARQDDPSEIERFVAELTSLIPDNTPLHRLPSITDTMIGVLRQIKIDRINKVKEFEATKAATEADQARSFEDRRSKSEHAKPAALTKAAVARRRKKFMMVAGAIAATIVIAGMGIDHYQDKAPQRQAKRMATTLVEQMQAAIRGDPIETHVYGGAIRTQRVGEYWAVEVEGLTLNQCVSAAWSFVFRGTVMINGAFPAKASVAALSTLCGNAPTNATLTWIPRSEGKQKDSKAKK